MRNDLRVAVAVLYSELKKLVIVPFFNKLLIGKIRVQILNVLIFLFASEEQISVLVDDLYLIGGRIADRVSNGGSYILGYFPGIEFLVDRQEYAAADLSLGIEDLIGIVRREIYYRRLFNALDRFQQVRNISLHIKVIL